jgi:HSP20 family protein
MMNARLLPTFWTRLNRLHGEVDRLLDRFGFDLPRSLPLAPTYPLVNVWEDADAFRVEAELPGLKQEDVQVAVTNRKQVTIQGERKPDEAPQGTWHRRERGFGRFQRSFTLPAAIDADKVEAKLEQGVLKLTLPKAEEAKPRKIAVKAE